MKISHATPPHAIAERMGTEATEADGLAMLKILMREGVTDTQAVEEAQWLAWCCEATRAVHAAGVALTVRCN